MHILSSLGSLLTSLKCSSISNKYPNMRVTGANGQVVYGKNKDGKAVIKGVKNDKGDGTFITYKDGKKVAEKGANYVSPEKTVHTPKTKIKDDENKK